jgi:nitroreductase
MNEDSLQATGPAAARLRPDEIADAIRARRSINLFEPGPVGTEALMTGIELARWAPNHKLTEPWRFYVVGQQTREAIIEFGADYERQIKGERAAEVRRARLAGIPAYFVLTSRRSEDALVERENYAACCCAVENLMLYLWQCGIGVKWSTGAMTRQPRFYEIVGIDADSEDVVGMFWYGRPKVVPTQKRLPVEEIVIERP